jgi:hypothetical protein
MTIIILSKDYPYLIKVVLSSTGEEANTLGVHNFTTYRENILFNCLLVHKVGFGRCIYGKK